MEFKVEGRNGYYGIDEYQDDVCTRHIISDKSQKQADSICYYLNTVAFERNQAVELLQKAQAALPNAWNSVACNIPKETIEEIDLFLLKHK
jgi:hypothetical protein